MSQMGSPPMVATAKLANCNKKKDTNSTVVVRSSVPRFNITGGLYSVAQWCRKVVEDNLEWIVKLIRRHHPDEKVVMLVYGDGCQTIVLLDEAINKMPADISKIKQIPIGVSSAPIDSKEDESKMAGSGVLSPMDPIWDHLRYESSQSEMPSENNAKDSATTAKKKKKEMAVFIHTCMTVYGDGSDGRRRVLQVKTKAPEKPMVAVDFVPNPVFEHQVLLKWKGLTPGAADQQRFSMAMAQGQAGFPMFPVNPAAMGMAAAAAHVAATTSPEEEEETLVTFNPKELILLEKAFDDSLTKRDLKAKADKWSEDDKKNCQLIIKRANNEFKWVTVKSKKRKATAAPKKAEKKPKTAASTSATKAIPEKKTEAKKTEKKETPAKKKETPAKKGTPAKKTTKSPAVVKKKEDTPPLQKEEDPAEDSDDEPISKLKEKKEVERKNAKKQATKRTPAKKTPAKSKTTPAKKKATVTPKEESPKKRGRPSRGSKAKDDPTPTKKTRRSTSSKPSTRSRK